MIRAMNIRKRTKRFLAETGWSQEKLAKAIGVHVISLNRYLNAQRRQSTGEKLADFFETFERKAGEETADDAD